MQSNQKQAYLYFLTITPVNLLLDLSYTNLLSRKNRSIFTNSSVTTWFFRWNDTCKTGTDTDRKSTRLNSSHVAISYAVFCLKKKRTKRKPTTQNRTPQT